MGTFIGLAFFSQGPDNLETQVMDTCEFPAPVDMGTPLEDVETEPGLNERMVGHEVTTMVDEPETPCLPLPPRCLDAAMVGCSSPVCNSPTLLKRDLGTKIGCEVASSHVVEEPERISVPDLDLELSSPTPVERALGTKIGCEVGSYDVVEDHEEIPFPNLDLELGSCGSPLSVERLAACMDPYCTLGSPAGDGSEFGARSPTLCFGVDSDQDVDMKDDDQHGPLPAAPKDPVQKAAVSCMHCSI